MIAVGGKGWPVGQASRNEPAGIPPAATTVKFTETAAIDSGRPHVPLKSHVRVVLFVKMPPWIGAPLPRVSTIRHGWTATNVRGSVTSVRVWMPPAEDCVNVGTVQFRSGTSTDCA